MSAITMCQKNVLNVQNSLQAVPQLQYIKIAVVVQGRGDGKLNSRPVETPIGICTRMTLGPGPPLPLQ